MYKIYKKSELCFSVIIIVIYSIIQSVAIAGNNAVGVDYSVSALVTVILSILLYCFVRRNDLLKYYGFKVAKVQWKHFLCFIPMLILVSINLWNGVTINLPFGESVCYLVYMMSVAFVEEMLFRGFLFNALSKDGLRMAVIISSLTFGLGHLFNMINGNGMTVFSNLCQVAGAIAVGLLFAVVLIKTGSIWPGIVTHAAIDMVSLFANEDGLTNGRRALFGIARIIIVAVYLLFIISSKQEAVEEESKDVGSVT